MKFHNIHRRGRFYLREKSYLQRVCDALNKILPCEGDGDIDKRYMEAMDILRRMYDYNLPPYNFGLFFNKRLYEMCGFDHDRAWNMFLFSGITEVVISDDMVEHPGVIVRFKRDRC